MSGFMGDSFLSVVIMGLRPLKRPPAIAGVACRAKVLAAAGAPDAPFQSFGGLRLSIFVFSGNSSYPLIPSNRRDTYAEPIA